MYSASSQDVPGLAAPEIQKAARVVVDLVQLEMYHTSRSSYTEKHLPAKGRGSPVMDGIGLSWSGFRPSDDPCQFGYLIPANLFAVVTLHWLSEIARDRWGDAALAADAATLSTTIKAAVAKHGTTVDPKYGPIYCYEVDGYGGCNKMDDANVPSLLALPYIDTEAVGYDRTIYTATRKWVLSPSNPQYVSTLWGAAIHFSPLFDRKRRQPVSAGRLATRRRRLACLHFVCSRMFCRGRNRSHRST
jgi:meiotically up-regulated gene 157 (Mug157) protein